MKKIFLMTICLMASVRALAVGVEFNLSGDGLMIGVGDATSSKIIWGVNGYYNKDNSGGGYVYIGSSFVDNQQSPWVFSVSVMGHAMHISHFTEGVNYALSVGGTLGYKFLTSVPTGIFFDAQYAPSVVTSGAMERMWLLSTSFQVMMNEASIFSIGYLNHTMKFDGNQQIRDEQTDTYKMFNSLYAGFKFRF